MVKLVNRAKMTIASTGSSTLALGSAVDGFQSFADAGVTNGDTVRYVIEDGDAWEIGFGIYAASNTSLSRTVSESSNGGAPVALSVDAVVFVSAIAADIVQPGDSITKLANTAGYTTNVGDITNVTAGAGLSGGGASGSVSLSHADTSSQGSLNNAGATVIQDVTLDTYGHVTALGPVTITPALIGAATSSHAHIIADVSGLQTTLNTKASVVYVDTAVASLVDTAPSTLDTLNELAAALGDDPNFATTVSNQIGTKLNATANAVSASKWQTARTIALAGDLSGSAALDGTSNITISATVADDSHNHTVANVDGLQAALDSKLAATGKAADSNLLDGNDSAHFYPASNPNGYTTNVGDITGINAGSGLTGGGAGGTVTLAHADTSTQASVNNSGATFIQDVTLDAYGHVTVLSSTTVTPATIGAQPAGTYNTVIGTDDDIDTSGSSIIGNIFVTDGVITSMGTRTLTAGDIGAYPASNPNGYTNNIGDITGVTAGSGLSGGGTSGTVTLNHADTSTQSSVNNSGSTYIQDISVDAYGHITSLGSATIPVASTTTAGLMATGDKTQLDALSAALGAAFTVQAVNATTFSSARLVFRHNGIAIMSLDTGGNLTLKGNVTAFGSV